MKNFEFITEVDWTELRLIGGGFVQKDDVEAHLNQTAQKGWTDNGTRGHLTINPAYHPKIHAKEAWFFLREIEEEKCECIVQRANEQKFNTEAGFSVSYVKNNFCPKCGEKLK